MPKRCGIDLLSVSAHKIHGPKGVGALYINKGVRIKPYVLGGGQEEGICSGTQGMPAIAGFAAAVGAFGSTQENLKKVTALRDELLTLVSEIPGVQIHSPADALPYIVNLSLAEIPSQVSVNFLRCTAFTFRRAPLARKGTEVRFCRRWRSTRNKSTAPFA